MQHPPEPGPEPSRLSPMLPHRHTVIVDGKTIYDGTDWDEAVRVWIEHGKNPEFGYAEHLIDGRQAALWGSKPQ